MHITDFLVPDTALAAAATAILVDSCPLPLVNHCRRTYVFGAGLLSQAGRDFDAELLYVSAALHDLGLTEVWEDGVTPFELRGADVARDALLARGADKDFVGRVHDAIALHLKASTAHDPRPEIAGVSIGAAVDVLGLRLDELPAGFAEEALERFPRHDFKTFIIAAIEHQVALKPTSLIAGHVEKYHFTDLVAAAPFDS